MIELIPHPDWLQVLVEIDDYVAQDIGCGADVAWNGRRCPEDIREHQPVSVGQWRDLVMKLQKIEVVLSLTRRGVLGLQLIREFACRDLAHDIPCEVYLSNGDNRSRGSCGAAML